MLVGKPGGRNQFEDISTHEKTILSRSMDDITRGFGLDIAFIVHLYTQLGTTCNYSSTANLHISQITTAPGKHFPVCCVFTSFSLITASNSGILQLPRSSPL
jgi:hypothetical protein